ncbi:MAG TPA: ABC transporter substrate-binding protein [Alphaproteobacteria bacterium]|nr:ABC transporter substrate-binding protein [Alphaproteobacteria bacterium]
MSKTETRETPLSASREHDTGPRLKRRQFLTAAGAGAALLLAPGALRAQSANGRVAIGVMGPFTGPASRTGDAFKKGVQMALEDARKDKDLPLTIGGQKFDVDIVWVDSQSDPEKAVKAVLDALNRQHVKFLITGWHSSVAMAVMDTEVPFHVVHLGHMGEAQTISEKLLKDPKKYAGWFKGWPAPPIFAGLYGPPLEYFMKQGLWKPATRKAAVLVEDTDYGRGWGQALTDSLKKAGFTPLPYDVTPLDQTEFAPLLTKYRAEKVSVVAMTSTGSVSASNFVKQYANSHIKALMIGHGLTWFSEWYKLTGTASNYIITADSPHAIAPWQKDWVKTYKAKYNEEPSLAPSGMPYDYTRMAFKIINKAGTWDFATLTKTVHETPYKGVWQYYKFSDKAGPHALAPNEVETGPFMEGFFFPLVQLMNGDYKIIWPTKYADAKFTQPPWV